MAKKQIVTNKNKVANKEEIRAEISRHQRKLIPLNIVVMVLALISAFTLLFAPFIKVDFARIISAMTEVMIEQADIGDGEEQIPEEQSEAIDEVFGAFEGMEFSLSTFTLAKFAFSEDPSAWMVNTITTMLNDSVDKIVANFAVTMAIESLDESIDRENNVSWKDVDSDRILNSFKSLETVTAANRDVAIDEVVNVIASEMELDLSAEERENMRSSLNDIYDNTVENNNGEFTVEAFICVSASAVFADSDNDEHVYTNFADLISGIFDLENGDEESFAGTLNTVFASIKYFAIAMIFFAVIWLVLFVFAFIHTFLPNKRFTMWYVKLFGPYPCIIFWLVPLIAGKVLTSLVSEMGSMFSGIFGAISSLTWISGLCYLLLWGVSIFWAFPIKRKIRRLNKQLKEIR